MAKVILIGLEQSTASQIGRALAGLHDIILKQENTPAADVLDADIVFAGCDRGRYKTLLKSVRRARPNLPFIVVTRVPETSEWLDALEAGATDYCAAPFEPRQLGWLMQNALPKEHAFAAA